MQAPRTIRYTASMPSGASPLPQLAALRGGRGLAHLPLSIPRADCIQNVGAGLLAMQAPRTISHTASMPSGASPLPQLAALRGGGGLAHMPLSTPQADCIQKCGSGLARDAGTSDHQLHRVDAIGSKPPPTVGSTARWQGACPPPTFNPPSRLQSKCGSGLARDAGTSDHQVHRVDAIGSKPPPTVGGAARWQGLCPTPTFNPPSRLHSKCGSGLARDAGTSDHQVHRVDAIGSKPPPTVGSTARWQGLAPCHFQPPKQTAVKMWERACSRCRHLGPSVTPCRCHREQAPSHSWQLPQLAAQAPSHIKKGGYLVTVAAFCVPPRLLNPAV